MLVGDLRISRFNLAVFIRLRRSALHSSFNATEEMPGGLLLLELDADGVRAWLATTSRLLLAVAREPEPLPVAGSEVRRDASAMHPTNRL